MTVRLDDATALLEQLRAGLGADEVARAVLARARETEHLNLFVPPCLDGLARRAREAGPGPLHGLPIAVKDSIDTAQLPTGAGTPALAGRRPQRDSAVVAALRAAGAVVAGKNTMHELSFGMTSNNAFTGPPRNPHDPTLTAGGSSGGTAAAVAAGVVPIGLGGDTGGSVRQPASLCGIVGFRPSVGRYPTAGIVPLSHSRDTAGVLARTVADVRLIDSVLAGDKTPQAAPDTAAPSDRGVPTRESSRGDSLAGLRLGVPVDYWSDLDAPVERVCRAAARRLSAAGVTLVDVDLSGLTAVADEIGLFISFYEFPRDLAQFLGPEGPDVSEVLAAIASSDVRQVVELTGTGLVDEAAYRTSLTRLATLRTDYAGLLDGAGVDALLFPTSPLPARPLGQDETTTLNDRQVSTFLTYMRHVNLAGVAGHPGISLPAGLTDSGLPVGLELDGRRGRDADLLAAAQLVEPVLRRL